MTGLDLVEMWSDVRRLTRAVAEAMPAAGYGFRPVPEAMSFAEQLLHVLASEQTLVDALATGRWQWDRRPLGDAPATREALLARLAEQFDATAAFLRSLPEGAWREPRPVPWGEPETVAELVHQWIVHEVHHRGQLVVYLRLNGIQPPPYA